VIDYSTSSLGRFTPGAHRIGGWMGPNAGLRNNSRAAFGRSDIKIVSSDPVQSIDIHVYTRFLVLSRVVIC
jgi:hypothetical protein